MIKNYFKTILRNAGRNPVYTFINIAGLALGLAACLVIGLFVKSELSYDRFYEDSNRMYRIVQEEQGSSGLAWSGPQMGIKLKQDFPQVESAMRIIDGGNGYGTNALISNENEGTGQVQSYNEQGFLYADPGFFDFFSFELVRGTPGEVLNRPGTVVITKSFAKKYFGNDDPVGKILMLENNFPLEVTGVAADPPDLSHIGFNFVTSYRTFYSIQGISGEVDSFWWPPTHTYVKLKSADAASELREYLPDFFQRHRDQDDASRLTALLQPVTDIWLGPDYRGQIKAGGSMIYIYLFSAIAVFILVLACVNFMNLSTARSGKRAKEIGIRKSIGAARNQITLQFLVESVFFSLAAMVLAFLLAEFMLPFFNGIALRDISIPYQNGAFWGYISGVVLITGLGAGSYPALYLSGFRPSLTIKQATGQPSRGAGLRKGLVVFQFTVSLVLLVGAVVVYQQLQYAVQVRVGFDKDEVVVINSPGSAPGDEAAASQYSLLREKLLNRAAVKQVTSVSHRPGFSSGTNYVWEGEGLPPEPNRQYPVQFVGENYFDMLNVNMITGRPLRPGNPADIGTVRDRTGQDLQSSIVENRAIVINQTAAKRMGWSSTEALGKQLRFYITENGIVYQDYRGYVVGVVEDYHTASIHNPIEPVAFMPSTLPGGDYLGTEYTLVKAAAGNTGQLMSTLEQSWKQAVPDLPFNASFLDESLNEMYRQEIRLGQLITVFTLLAIAIACLGLFGLAAYTAEARTKEIGIRKILGATVTQIISLISVDFVKLVMAGFAVAVPVAWYIVDQWLQNFAYRIDIGWQVFVFAGLGALLLAVVTVSWQSIRAATANPVNSLRSE